MMSTESPPGQVRRLLLCLPAAAAAGVAHHGRLRRPAPGRRRGGALQPRRRRPGGAGCQRHRRPVHTRARAWPALCRRRLAPAAARAPGTCSGRHPCADERRAPPGTERWREGDLRKRALTRPDAAAADVLLHPDIGYYAGLSREYRERCIGAGYRETMAAATRIKALHSA